MQQIDKQQLLELRQSPAFRALHKYISDNIQDAVMQTMESITVDNPDREKIADKMINYSGMYIVMHDILSVDFDTLAEHFKWVVEKEGINNEFH